MPKSPCDICGSSDGREFYEDHSYCFASCEDKDRWQPLSGEQRRNIVSQPDAQPAVDLTRSGFYKAISDRGISEETCKKYKVSITDCLSVAEFFDRKWDVVSVRNGAQAAKKELQDQLEFLEGYDHIVLCFDNDAEGDKAVKQCREIFSPGKVRIMQLPDGMKDPNAMLKARATKAFMDAFWNAKEFSPVGIVNIKDTWGEVLKYKETPSVPYPWSGLDQMLLGQRKKEIVVWAAETGVGKSQTMREIQHHIVNTTDSRAGCLMLEESVAKTTVGWMSFAAGFPLHKQLKQTSNEDLRRYWEKATAGDKFTLLDHRGWQNNLDTLKARIRYMRHALNCEWIVLDHLHIALSSIKGASQDWSGIDELMTDLVGLVQDVDVGLHLVSHVSEGRSLRGSKGIEKLADAVVYLERDKHTEDPMWENVTTVVVDKNRFAGDTGVACYLKYNPETGRMAEIPKPVSLDDSEF
jgi:twinkle protein